MADRIQKIVTTLPALKSVTDVWKTADRSLLRGDAAFLADLGIALAGAYASDTGRIWQYRSVFDYLLRLLATTPGPGNVAAALRLVSSTEAADRKLDRYAASLLASSHPVEELAVAFTGNASEELRACLVQEAVLRGADVTEALGVAGWATSPHWRHHPLGWLPLVLSAVEGKPDLPSHSARGGSSHSMPYGPSANREVRGVAWAHAPSVKEMTTAAASKGIGAAVANWAEESNGRIEARVFDLATPLVTESVPNMLLGLGLECLKGAREKTAFSVAACPPDHAWRVLFAAASTGGAYNSGARGAYGRLAAWQSLAALSGTAEGGPAEEVEACARECDWYGFGADTKWFERVAWDIGLASVSPGRRRLAVLAATDTD